MWLLSFSGKWEVSGYHYWSASSQAYHWNQRIRSWKDSRAVPQRGTYFTYIPMITTILYIVYIPFQNLSFPDANKKSDIINIRGDKGDVDKVFVILTKIAKDLVSIFLSRLTCSSIWSIFIFNCLGREQLPAVRAYLQRVPQTHYRKGRRHYQKDSRGDSDPYWPSWR